MKSLHFLVFFTPLFTTFAALAEDAQRAANTVVLNEIGVKNLRIETVEVAESDFEETAFSLGRIEAIPQKIAAVSSRIAGRLLSLQAQLGETVIAGQELARIESRLAGDPPPVIVLKAPQAGLITRLETRLGDPVEPEKALLEITDLREVQAVARVPEHLAGRMRPGLAARVQVAALPEAKLEGRLLRFGTEADRESGTIDAIFALASPEGNLRPGMRAEFNLVLSQRPGVMAVPRSALQGDAANRFVFVEDFELPHAFLKTPVVVGQINDRFVEIISGLLPGDKVVAQGAYSLAFAGGGGVSLKEALDAAHGHEHAADGSELKPEDREKTTTPHGASAPASSLWPITSGVLFLALLGALFWKWRPAHVE